MEALEVLNGTESSQANATAPAISRRLGLKGVGGGLNQAAYDAFAQFRDDRQARVATLTGRGARAFCAGGDLIETSERRKAEAAGQAVPDEENWLSRFIQ